MWELACLRLGHKYLHKKLLQPKLTTMRSEPLLILLLI